MVHYIVFGFKSKRLKDFTLNIWPRVSLLRKSWWRIGPAPPKVGCVNIKREGIDEIVGLYHIHVRAAR